MNAGQYIAKYGKHLFKDKVRHICKICEKDLLYYNESLIGHLKPHGITLDQYADKYLIHNKPVAVHLTSAKKSRKRKPKLVQSEQVEKKIVTILRDNIQDCSPVNGTCIDNVKQENALGSDNTSFQEENNSCIEDNCHENRSISSQIKKEDGVKTDVSDLSDGIKEEVEVKSEPPDYTDSEFINTSLFLDGYNANETSSIVRYTDQLGDYSTFGCHMCAFSGSYRALIHHLSNKHALTLKASKKIHGEIIVIEKVLHNCKICAREMLHTSDHLDAHMRIYHGLKRNAYIQARTDNAYLRTLMDQYQDSQKVKQENEDPFRSGTYIFPKKIILLFCASKN